MAEAINNRFSFGEFELDADRRVLLKRGETVPLKSKTIDLLIALIEKRGEVLSKNALLDVVWENQFVEENNLTVHVAALRKVLGETKNENRYIVTVPGKGYRFVAPVFRPADEEVLVERHSVERIIIEESEYSEIDPPVKMMPLPSGRTLPRWLYAFIAIPVLAAGAYFWGGGRPGSATNESSAVRTPVLRAFATAAGIPQRVSISPDGNQIAYVERSKGKDSVWLGDLETNQSRRLTDVSERLHNSLTFSPDGKNVYFTARDANHPQWSLSRVSIASGTVTDLNREIRGNPAFSPDGRSVAYFGLSVGIQQEALIIADVELGGNERLLFQPEAGFKVTGRGPAWSPDGKLVAFGLSGGDANVCELTTIDVSSGESARLGNNLCEGAFALAWLNDGSGLVMSAPNEDAAADNQIWHVTYPSGEKKQLTNNPASYTPLSISAGGGDRVALLEIRHDSDISIAPIDDPAASKVVLQRSLRNDGAVGLAVDRDGKILHVARIAGRRSIWQMNADGSELRQLIPSDDRSDEQLVSVTPDNRFLVFESLRSGASEIWRANRDGSGLTQLTSGGNNSQPALSPDGSHVYFTSQRHGALRIWRVAISGGEAEQMTHERTSWPDVSPDGKLLACARRDHDTDRDRLGVYQVSDGNRIRSFELARGGVLFNRLRWAPHGRSIIYKDIVQGLWSQPLDGGDARAIFDPDDLRVFHFAFTPDGQMVHSSGIQARQIVIMENFR